MTEKGGRDGEIGRERGGGEGRTTGSDSEIEDMRVIERKKENREREKGRYNYIE